MFLSGSLGKLLIRRFTWKNITIPIDKLNISFSRSGGAGGQNVNKVNTKVEFRFNIENAEWISPEIKSRLIELFPNKINNNGEFLVTSQEHRTQEENKKEAAKKLQMIIYEASQPKNERIHHEIVETDSQRDHRIKEKKNRSKLKNLRKGNDDRY